MEMVAYLAAAVVAVPIAHRLGLGSILGYLLAGVIVGPSVLGWVGHFSSEVMSVSEFGVIMLLFLVGLELEPKKLWQMRGTIFGLGGLQVIVTGLAFTIPIMLLGLPFPSALAAGLILSFSSTAIVLPSLQEKGLTHTAGGRAAFAVLLSQDLAVIPILALLPFLAVGHFHLEGCFPIRVRPSGGAPSRKSNASGGGIRPRHHSCRPFHRASLFPVHRHDPSPGAFYGFGPADRHWHCSPHGQSRS